MKKSALTTIKKVCQDRKLILSIVSILVLNLLSLKIQALHVPTTKSTTSPNRNPRKGAGSTISPSRTTSKPYSYENDITTTTKKDCDENHNQRSLKKKQQHHQPDATGRSVSSSSYASYSSSSVMSSLSPQVEESSTPASAEASVVGTSSTNNEVERSSSSSPPSSPAPEQVDSTTSSSSSSSQGYKGGPTTLLPPVVLDFYNVDRSSTPSPSRHTHPNPNPPFYFSSRETKEESVAESLQPKWVNSLYTGDIHDDDDDIGKDDACMLLSSSKKDIMDPLNLFGCDITGDDTLEEETIISEEATVQEVAATTTTRTTTVSSNDDTNDHKPFSLLSWNILVQSLYEKQKDDQHMRQQTLRQDYLPSIPKVIFDWSQRLDWIMEHICKANSDVVCLQEVEEDKFYTDLLPKMQQLGYDGVVQGDVTQCHEIKRRKGKGVRAHVVATFWKYERFVPYEVFYASAEANPNPNSKNDEGNFPAAHMARGRTMTTLLQDISALMEDEDDEDSCSTEVMADDKQPQNIQPHVPILAVINCHLEGHPRQYAARIRQVQHAMNDLSKRVAPIPTSAKKHQQGQYPLNGLVIAGDFNCELQSSACSTYLRMGRIGRKGGLGGIHGTSAIVMPPSLLESQEALEILNPVLEWGHTIPNEEMEQVEPHPFRRNSMVSAYPPQNLVGPYETENKNGSYDYFYTYCANPHRPVAGLDQVWYSKSTMTCRALKRPVAQFDSAKQILETGLPAPSYPSDHLPIGSIWEWRYDDKMKHGNDDEPDIVRELVIAQDQPPPEPKPKSPIMAYAELDMLLVTLPYDSEFQRAEVEELIDLSDDVTSQLPDGKKPSPEQLAELRTIRTRKQDLFKTASETTRPLLQRVFKLKKQVTAYEQEFFGM